MVSENLMMLAVKAGGDRQQLHESIRDHAMEVVAARRAGDDEADLLVRLAEDPLFESVRDSISEVSDPADYIGCSAAQVERFFAEEVRPALELCGPGGARRMRRPGTFGFELPGGRRLRDPQIEP